MLGLPQFLGPVALASFGASQTSVGSSLANRIAAIPFLIRTGGAMFQGEDLTPALSGDPVGLWLNEVSGISAHQIIALTDADRPLLQAGGSILFNGVNNQLGFEAPTGGFPSDCDVFFVVRSTDTQAILARGDGADYFNFLGAADIGSGASTAVKAGSPTTFVDGVAVENSRNALHAKAFDGAWRVVRVAGADLSSWLSFFLSGYADGWRLDGELGPRFLLYDNANGPLSNAQLADIQAYAMEGLS